MLATQLEVELQTQRWVDGMDRLIIEHPICSILLRQKLCVNLPNCLTAAVSVKRLMINTDFVATLTDDGIRVVAKHEAYHILLGHFFRTGDRNRDLAGQAQDFEINGELVNQGDKIPEGGLYEHKYRGWAFEDIYADMLSNFVAPPPPINPGEDGYIEVEGEGTEGGESGEGNPGPSDDSDESDDTGDTGNGGNSEDESEDTGNSGDGDEDSDESEDTGDSGNGESTDEDSTESDDESNDKSDDDDEDLSDLPDKPFAENWGECLPAEGDEVEQAEQQAELQSDVAQAIADAGNIPGNLKALLNAQADRKQKADWRELLRQWIDSGSRKQSSWQQPDRRFVHHNIYLPSDSEKTIGTLVLGMDISGSTGPWWKMFANHFQRIVDQVNPESVYVIYCDTRASYKKFQRGQRITFQTEFGGGGTEFAPVFDLIKQLHIRPSGLVFCTDLMAYDWNRIKRPGYPVLFAYPTEVKRWVRNYENEIARLGASVLEVN